MTTFLKSVSGRLIGGGIGTSFMSAHESKLGVSRGYVGSTLVGIVQRETYMLALGEKDVMCNGKEPVEDQGGGTGAANIMEFWIMLICAVGFFIGVAVVVVRNIIGCNKG